MKVHKGDTVLVIAGRTRAPRQVLQAYPARNRVLVQGVNRIKKHVANSANQAAPPRAGSSRRKPRSTSRT